MSIGLLVSVLQIAAPSVLAGTAGAVLAHIQNPITVAVIGLGKKAAKGDHLSDEDKEFIHEYNKRHGLGPGGSAHPMLHR